MKILVSFALLLGLVGLAYSGNTLVIPQTQDGNPIYTSDYGGVKYTTSSFSAQMVTACVGSGVSYGVYFSTGVNTNMDLVTFYDSSTTYNALSGGATVYSVYNSGTAGSSSTLTAWGFQGPPRPIRHNNGIFWRSSSALYNMITGLVNCNNP